MTSEKKEVEEETQPDPLTQLITALSRGATKEQPSSLPEDPLYISYAEIMSLVGSILPNSLHICKTDNVSSASGFS